MAIINREKIEVKNMMVTRNWIKINKNNEGIAELIILKCEELKEEIIRLSDVKFIYMNGLSNDYQEYELIFPNTAESFHFIYALGFEPKWSEEEIKGKTKPKKEDSKDYKEVLKKILDLYELKYTDFDIEELLTDNTYKVEWYENEHNSTESNYYGYAIYRTQLIKMNKHVKGTAQENNTIQHEFTHIKLYELGFVNHCSDEELVSRIANLRTKLWK